jgi:predicted aspartyl protease
MPMRYRLLKAAAAAAMTALIAATPPATDGAAIVDEFAPLSDEQFDVLAFENDSSRRMTVPVSIAGKGPYRFLVDTGAERTVIARELAKRLQLSSGNRTLLHTMSGSGEVATVVIPKLDLSARSVRQIHAPSLGALDIGAVGMLGIDSLQEQRVVFDFTKKTMSITPSARLEQRWDPDTVIVTARSRYGRLVLVDAKAEGEEVLVIIDSGSQVTIGNEALRSRLIAKKKLGTTYPVELVSVTGGVATADLTSVGQVEIGGMMIKDLPMAFADVHPFKQLKLTDKPAVLLGMDAFKLFDRVSVDFARKKVRFLPPKSGSGTADPRPQSTRMRSFRSR